MVVDCNSCTLNTPFGGFLFYGIIYIAHLQGVSMATVQPSVVKSKKIRKSRKKRRVYDKKKG